MFKWIFTLLVTAAFVALASYSFGRYAHTPAIRTKPVSISRVAISPRCNETDWLCLVAWADEQHPKKGKAK